MERVMKRTYEKMLISCLRGRFHIPLEVKDFYAFVTSKVRLDKNPTEKGVKNENSGYCLDFEFVFSW
jgi:hypothetical protein